MIRRFLAERQPPGVGWPHTTGGILLSLILLQLVSGLLLAVYYASSTQTAWESIRYIQSEVPLGHFVRGLHHYGASAFVILIVLHMLVVFLLGAYKRPRRALWCVGVLLFLLVLAFGYTGYLLPWDMKGYFGTQVGTAITGSAPKVGPTLLRLLRGGEEVGQLTLVRFYALHVILLPLLLILLTAIHVALVRKLGVTPPGCAVGEGESEQERNGEPFAPAQLARDSVAALLVLGTVAALAWLFPAPLGPKADPTTTAYVPRPDWYFLGLQHLMRLFPGDRQYIATLVLPNLGILLLLLVPFIDRGRQRRLGARKLTVMGGLICLLSVVVLTIAGWREVQRQEHKLARATQPEPARPWFFEKAPDPARVKAGQALYQGLSCAGCHDEQELAPVNFAPPLNFQGDRTWRRWLVGYLAEPHPIAFSEKGRRPTARMPGFRLSTSELNALASFLSSRRQPSRFPRRFDPQRMMTAAAIARGQSLYQNKLCGKCHRVDPKGAGGKIGPDLFGAAKRLKPDFVWAITENPYKVNPETEMKNLGLKPDELEALVAYIMSLR